MTTYTAEQIIAIGGREWTGQTGIHRVYLPASMIADIIGLEIERYKSGNIQRAWVGDEKVSNAKAGRLLGGKAFWQDGEIHVTESLDDYADIIRAAVAGRVAATTPTGDDSGQGDAGQAVNRLRSAGSTVRQIAEMIGVSVSTIYRWARGICRPNNINAGRLAAIA